MVSRAGGRATQTVAQLILVISRHPELLPLVAARFPQAQSAHRISITAQQAASLEGSSTELIQVMQTCRRGAPFLEGSRSILNWVLFPSSAREASANTRQLCRADAMGLEGRGSQLSHLPWGLDPCPRRRLELGFLSLWSCARVLPLLHEPQLPASPFWGAGSLRSQEGASSPGLSDNRARLHRALHPPAPIPKTHT